MEAERLDRRDTVNRYEVRLQASRLGIVDPEAAEKLLDWAAVEYDDHGSPKNLEKALQQSREPATLAGGPAASGTIGAAGHERGQADAAGREGMDPGRDRRPARVGRE